MFRYDYFTFYLLPEATLVPWEDPVTGAAGRAHYDIIELPVKIDCVEKQIRNRLASL